MQRFIVDDKALIVFAWVKHSIDRMSSSAPTSSVDSITTNFKKDLEFVCCLANPEYLNSLAIQGYFDDEKFIRYLKYLLYFKRPEYVKYILFPHCLFFLEKLQNDKFRDSMKDYNFVMREVVPAQASQWRAYAKDLTKN